jgi:hypothetical protein
VAAIGQERYRLPRISFGEHTAFGKALEIDQAAGTSDWKLIYQLTQNSRAGARCLTSLMWFMLPFEMGREVKP